MDTTLGSGATVAAGVGMAGADMFAAGAGVATAGASVGAGVATGVDATGAGVVAGADTAGAGFAGPNKLMGAIRALAKQSFSTSSASIRSAAGVRWGQSVNLEA